MYRTLFKIPIPFTGSVIPVHSYGFMLAIAFFLGVFVARRRAKKEGIDPSIVSDLSIYVLCGGIVGARIFFVIQNFEGYKGHFIDVFKVYEGGLVFYGGLIGSTITFFVFAKKRELMLLKTMDIVFSSVALGLALGRIGCFLNGCCYGDVAGSDLFCAVKFPKTLDDYGRIDGSPVFLRHYHQGFVDLSESYSLPVHPTQIYSFVACLAIFFVLNVFWKYRKNDGDVMLLFGIIYSINRFCIEFLRDDNALLFDSLTISQNISIVFFLISITLFVAWKGRGLKIEN